MRELLAMHLRAAGYAVKVAEDAIAAGYAVLKAPPDLIVCDIGLPHMDGLEFVAALRADQTIAIGRIPVIFVTALEEGFERGKQLGKTEYLLKPLRADVLLDAVRKHLPGRMPLADFARQDAEAEGVRA
jgi:DNA-binding response OmpR family regulator